MTGPPRPPPASPLDAWLQETLPRALAYAASLLRDRVAAEDVVHDCYCRLLRKADVYDLPRDGMKILIRSIANACIDREGRSRVLASLDGLVESAGAQAVLADRRAEAPPEAMMSRELSAAIEAGLACLPMAQRAALEMKSLGESLESIGETLGITANHAGVLVHRARQDMARHLAPFLPGGAS